MPPIEVVNVPDSTLADVLGQVKDAFEAMGNATPIMVGKQYLKHAGVGGGPRVVFVPEQRGKVSTPYQMGSAASVVHGCDVYVRGPESGDDVERFRAAYALGDLVIDCLVVAATGAIDWGDYADGSPTDADAFGAELAFHFSYARDVSHDARRWGLPKASADTTGAVPAIPPGVAGTVDSIDVSTEPVEPEET